MCYIFPNHPGDDWWWHKLETQNATTRSTPTPPHTQTHTHTPLVLCSIHFCKPGSFWSSRQVLASFGTTQQWISTLIFIWVFLNPVWKAYFVSFFFWFRLLDIWVLELLCSNLWFILGRSFLCSFLRLIFYLISFAFVHCLRHCILRKSYC